MIEMRRAQLSFGVGLIAEEVSDLRSFGTPAEVVLRMLVLKHVRNWSYGVLEREVRSSAGPASASSPTILSTSAAPI